MSAAADSIAVRVPGSTSNCGAGFDTLGLALELYNRVTVTRAAGASPEPERSADARAGEMVAEAAAAFWKATGIGSFGFRYRIDGDVPPARGLGSSVTVTAGILAGLDALCGSALGRRSLVSIVTGIEGHPDNASAGILGGFCVSRTDPATGAYVDSQRFEVQERIAFVVASPALEQLTKESRGVLPASLPFFDAVKSVNCAAYLVAAFASGDYQRLRQVSGDFIHEPYRLPRIPGAADAVASGVAAGALTGWLSGSGTSVLCVCERPAAAAVGAAMKAAFARAGAASDIRILSADNRGLVVGA
jgi:homoserine kinase